MRFRKKVKSSVQVNGWIDQQRAGREKQREKRVVESAKRLSRERAA
jgi:hypothetical protein